MPKTRRKTDTSRIAEWVTSTVSSEVSSYMSFPDEQTLRWLYHATWRSIIEVFDSSDGQIAFTNMEEVVRKVAETIATDLILGRYPELPPDRARFWCKRVADIIYYDIWRYVASYLVVRRDIVVTEYREERVRRPRYRTTQHALNYIFRRIEEELRGMYS